MLFLTSCEYEAHLSYKIKNKTVSPIRVISTYMDVKPTADTFLIAPNNQATIAVIDKGLNRVSYYKEKDEKLKDFSNIDIFKNDTIKSTTDFLKTDRWMYVETNNRSANYTLTVLSTDF